MKINDRKDVLDPQLIGPDAVRGGPRGAGDGADPEASGDRVTVSDAARDLARLRAQVGDVDAVRSERVAALRAALDAGEYRVDPAALAKSVLGELLADHVQ